jgi:hypothetical protein
MGRTSAPLTVEDLEMKYRKTSWFLNRGCQRIVQLEECLLGVISRLEATEKALVWALENCAPELHKTSAKKQKHEFEVLRER